MSRPSASSGNGQGQLQHVRTEFDYALYTSPSGGHGVVRRKKFGGEVGSSEIVLPAFQWSHRNVDHHGRAVRVVRLVARRGREELC